MTIQNLKLLGAAQDPVKALPWVWIGPAQYKAVINSRWYATSRENPTLVHPALVSVFDVNKPVSQGQTWSGDTFRQKLTEGWFNPPGTTPPVYQNQDPVNPPVINTPVTDPRGGSSSTGSGFLGMSNTTLLIAGLAVIALIYFLKTKK